MGEESNPQSARRAGLTRERVVLAALAVLDELGAAGITVRNVAAELGVKAPALYRYVHSKQDLLDEMGTEIHRRIFASLSAARHADPFDYAVDYARAARAEYLQHRDGARTFSGTRLTDPQLLTANETWFAAARAIGMSLQDAADVGELVTAFTVGFVIEEQERAQSAATEPGRYDVVARDAALLPDAPLTAQAGHPDGSADERFERQLELVLAGPRSRHAGAKRAG